MDKCQNCYLLRQYLADFIAIIIDQISDPTYKIISTQLNELLKDQSKNNLELQKFILNFILVRQQTTSREAVVIKNIHDQKQIKNTSTTPNKSPSKINFENQYNLESQPKKEIKFLMVTSKGASNASKTDIKLKGNQTTDTNKEVKQSTSTERSFQLFNATQRTSTPENKRIPSNPRAVKEQLLLNRIKNTRSDFSAPNFSIGNYLIKDKLNSSNSNIPQVESFQATQVDIVDIASHKTQTNKTEEQLQFNRVRNTSGKVSTGNFLVSDYLTKDKVDISCLTQVQTSYSAQVDIIQDPIKLNFPSYEDQTDEIEDFYEKINAKQISKYIESSPIALMIKSHNQIKEVSNFKGQTLILKELKLAQNEFSRGQTTLRYLNKYSFETKQSWFHESARNEPLKTSTNFSNISDYQLQCMQESFARNQCIIYQRIDTQPKQMDLSIPKDLFLDMGLNRKDQ